MARRFVEWDAIALRVDGARIDAMVKEKFRGMVNEIGVTFRPGNIHVAGWKKIGFLPVPFSADVREILVEGRTILIPVAEVALIPTSVLGGLWSVVREVLAPKIPLDAVTVRKPLTFAIDLAKLVPPFADVDVREIRIVDRGLAVSVGPGGADPPLQ
jgi:hypothetical protein